MNGTWSTLAPMHDTRLFFATQMLKDGRLFMAGGEYGTGKTTGEVYDPVADAWTSTPASGHTFSDANSAILPDGRVLIALVEGSLTGCLIYNPITNTWAAGPSTQPMMEYSPPTRSCDRRTASMRSRIRSDSSGLGRGSLERSGSSSSGCLSQ